MPFSYQIERAIGAVMLKPSWIATKLKCGAVVRIVGPSQRVPGLIEIECDGTTYAIFEVDLEEYGTPLEERAAQSFPVS